MMNQLESKMNICEKILIWLMEAGIGFFKILTILVILRFILKVYRGDTTWI